MKHLRPIGLYTVLYKILEETLTQKLQPYMNLIIKEN